MDFSEALLLMRDGHPMAREEWGTLTYLTIEDGRFCIHGVESVWERPLTELNILAVDWKRANPPLSFSLALQALKAGQCKKIRRAWWDDTDGLTYGHEEAKISSLHVEETSMSLMDISVDDWICE